MNSTNEKLNRHFAAEDQLAKTVDETLNIIDRIIAFEDHELDTPDIIKLFCDLHNAGMLSQLQGFYGRAFHGMKRNGVIVIDDAGQAVPGVVPE